MWLRPTSRVLANFLTQAYYTFFTIDTSTIFALTKVQSKGVKTTYISFFSFSYQRILTNLLRKHLNAKRFLLTRGVCTFVAIKDPDRNTYNIKGSENSF